MYGEEVVYLYKLLGHPGAPQASSLTFSFNPGGGRISPQADVHWKKLHVFPRTKCKTTESNNSHLKSSISFRKRSSLHFKIGSDDEFTVSFGGLLQQ